MSPQNDFPDHLTPREVLPAFYKKYNLDSEGGQNLPFVKVELFKGAFIFIPNFEVRKRAVLKHDIHHIVAGYASKFKGETEIGAWEIGSRVRKYWIAFLLDIQAVVIGMLFNPIGVFKAFIRGRNTKNLYTNFLPDEKVMDMTIGEIKDQLLLSNYNPKTKPRFSDLLIFAGLLLVGTVYSILSIVLLPFVLIYSLYIVVKYPKSSFA